MHSKLWDSHWPCNCIYASHHHLTNSIDSIDRKSSQQWWLVKIWQTDTKTDRRTDSQIVKRDSQTLTDPRPVSPPVTGDLLLSLSSPELNAALPASPLAGAGADFVVWSGQTGSLYYYHSSHIHTHSHTSINTHAQNTLIQKHTHTKTHTNKKPI